MNNELPQAIICDIDGTVADCSHRLHMIQGEVKKWEGFHLACAEDKPIRPITWLLTYFTEGAEIIWITGRPERTRSLTERWLWKNTTFKGSEDLFMRKDGDFRCDTEVKREIYEEHIRGKYEVLCVFEDRARVVKMWRELGLTCLQVAEGDY